jgi:hypothetical protein
MRNVRPFCVTIGAPGIVCFFSFQKFKIAIFYVDRCTYVEATE